MRSPSRSALAPLFAVILVPGGLGACSKHAAPAPSGSAATAIAEAPASDASAAGDARAEAVDPRFPGHVSAIAWEVKVHAEASLQSPMIGYLRAGAVVAASADRVSREGCQGGWYAIAPKGYVCVETNVATTDPNNPMAQALSQRPDPNARFPYMYGLVRQHSAIYSRIPTLHEAIHSEYGLRPHVEHWLRAKDGANFRADYWMRWKNEPAPDARELWENGTNQDIPSWLEGGAQPPGNLSGMIIGRRLVVGHTQEHQGFAFVDTAVSEGRRYAITTDLLVVPVDRLRPIEGSDYHGVRIPDDIDLPFAIIRRDGASSYELRGDSMAKRGSIPRRTVVKLSGKEQVVDGRLYFETAEGKWLSSAQASRVDGGLKKPYPKWAADGEHWVDVSIADQTLVAFDGLHAVYATLVSTGEAGLNDPQTTKSTVLGEFRIFAKHVTTTMSSEVVGEEFQLKDIPYVQYFQEGYALHAAYWHDDFGTPRSHGCINLAPDDAKWVFSFTAPNVPATWHGAHAANNGSVVNVHP